MLTYKKSYHLGDWLFRFGFCWMCGLKKTHIWIHLSFGWRSGIIEKWKTICDCHFYHGG